MGKGHDLKVICYWSKTIKDNPQLKKVLINIAESPNKPGNK